MAIIDVKDPCSFDPGAGAGCLQLEQGILPRYLLEQRWYGAKGDAPPVVRVDRSISVGPGFWMLILAVTVEQQMRHYFVPVNAIWDAPMPSNGVIARLSSESSSGWLIDAFCSDSFVRALLRGICKGSIEENPNGLIFRRSTSFHSMPDFPDHVQIARVGAEQSNTSIIAGNAILKAYRRLEEGIHPELELGAFLTDTVGFKNVPELLGTIEYVHPGTDQPAALCVLQRLVKNKTTYS